jgi:hypothetical protein
VQADWQEGVAWHIRSFAGSKFKGYPAPIHPVFKRREKVTKKAQEIERKRGPSLSPKPERYLILRNEAI